MIDVIVALSNVADGSMFIPDDRSNITIADNRARFLNNHDIKMDQSTRVNITYDSDSFCRYQKVTLVDNAGMGMRDDDMQPADALITTDTNHALFLPLADCVGAVIYDPVHHVLMLSHLGRHSTEQFSGRKSVSYLADTYGSDPADLRVWLTPAPGKDAYPMWAFNNRSIKEVVIDQLTTTGILMQNIHDDATDTTKDPNLFSHSEFLAGRRSEDGRYAIVAMMREL